MDRGLKRGISESPSAPVQNPPPKSTRMEDLDTTPDTPSSPSSLSAEGQNPPPTPPALSIEELAESLLTTQLSQCGELNDQSRTIIRLTVSITAQLISSQNSNSTHLHHQVSNLNSAVTKLEQDMIHHETVLSGHTLSIKDHEYELKSLTSRIDQLIAEKDRQILDLQNSLSTLQIEFTGLQKDVISNKLEIDEVDQYERRDTLIFSGPSVPRERMYENVPEIIVRFIRENFSLPLNVSHISVCHRLGPHLPNKERPIICKFISRSIKSDIKNACATIPCGIFANESLTSVRKDMFQKLRTLKHDHPRLVEQLYTVDGKIWIKVQASERRTLITNPHNLHTFLEKYPVLKDSYESY